MVAVVEMAVEHAIVAGFADLAQEPAGVDIEVAAGSAGAAVVEFLDHFAAVADAAVVKFLDYFAAVADAAVVEFLDHFEAAAVADAELSF